MIIQLLQYAAGIFVGTDAPTKSTVAIRDTAGNLNATSFTGDLISNGSLVLPVATAYTANFAIPVGDFLVVPINCTGGAVTGTLPPASANEGEIAILKKLDNVNNATIACSGSDTIDGASTKTMSTQYGTLRLYSDGTVWWTF
jgi:hypothetical protein